MFMILHCYWKSSSQLGLEISLNIIADAEVQAFDVTVSDKNFCSFREELKQCQKGQLIWGQVRLSLIFFKSWLLDTFLNKNNKDDNRFVEHLLCSRSSVEQFCISDPFFILTTLLCNKYCCTHFMAKLRLGEGIYQIFYSFILLGSYHYPLFHRKQAVKDSELTLTECLVCIRHSVNSIPSLFDFITSWQPCQVGAIIPTL